MDLAAAPLLVPPPVDEGIAVRARQARDYVARMADSLETKVQDVASEVVVGAPVAAQILDYANEHSVDLIALATRGHSGVKRLVLGSVADKLIRAATVPVLVVPADNSDGSAP
jgi:nucleotide-binding universal stress UspA family protein